MVHNLVMVTSDILLLIFKFWRALRGVASHPIHPPVSMPGVVGCAVYVLNEHASYKRGVVRPKWLSQ